MVTYIFPGQGSQHKGMGKGLFDDFIELTAAADRIMGMSVRKLCLEDSDRKLGETRFTQPALYTVNALAYLKKVRETGRNPDFVAGHSLGEYSALFAAGVFDFETGLQLVKKRGEIMSEAAGGGMAAVIGLDPEKVEGLLKSDDLKEVHIANFNSFEQIVISGAREAIARSRDSIEAAGGKYVPLNVSGAFHSPFMADAAKRFEEFAAAFDFRKPTIPILSNVDARPYEKGNVKKNMVDQITSPVRWTDIVLQLIAKGEMNFEEIGPGSVLTKLIQSIRKTADSRDRGTAAEAETMGNPWGNGKKKPDAGGRAPSDAGKIVPVQKSRGKSVGASLGSSEFRSDYNLTYAYASGSMYRGISSKELVVKMGKAGMMGFLGTGGLDMPVIEKSIQDIQKELPNGEAYGMNLLFNPGDPKKEEETVDLYLKYGVRTIEASAYMSITPALVRYRAEGLRGGARGAIFPENRIIAKVSRPEVALLFLSPAPDRLVEQMAQENKITHEQAELLKRVPLADDLCVEADSGGHTDGGVAYTLMPAMLKLRDDMMEKHRYAKKVRIGAAGGIATPESAAAALVLGADFILTGSINQCTVEAGTSAAAKDMLRQINVQDTEYAPAGDMFEMGAKVQVMKRGVLFPARANKLYDLYKQHNSLDEVDGKTKKTIQEKYFKRSFEEIYREAQSYYPPQEIERAERNPKQKMAMIFKWYFGYSTRLALNGTPGCEVDYQIHCGPALGAFNQWVKGTPLEDWRNRNVDAIGAMLMEETTGLLKSRFTAFFPDSRG